MFSQKYKKHEPQKIDLNIRVEHFVTNDEIHTSYYKHDNLHRDPSEGPALEIWYPNGNLKERKYYYNGKLYNPNGPSEEYFYEDGSPKKIIYSDSNREIFKAKMI